MKYLPKELLMSKNFVFTYKQPDECPCCGKVGRLLSSINDDIIHNSTNGKFIGSGSGIGIGLGGGLGLYTGATVGNINTHTVSKTKLQQKTEPVVLPKSDRSSSVLKIIITFIGLSFIGLFSGMFVSCSSKLAMANDFSGSGVAMANGLDGFRRSANAFADTFIYFVILIPILGIIPLLFNLPRSMSADHEENEIIQKQQELLDSYYKNLRYCKNCHVIFDKQGFYTSVSDNAVFLLSSNANLGKFGVIHTRNVNAGV